MAKLQLRTFVLAAATIFLLTNINIVSNAEQIEVSDTDGEEFDNFIEKNLDYELPTLVENNKQPNDDDSAYSSDDSEYDIDSNEEEEMRDIKFKLNNAVSKEGIKKSIKFVKKNKNAIYVTLAIFAFRREIWYFILSISTTQTIEGKRKITLSISPTAILKLALFIDTMRKVQSPSNFLANMPRFDELNSIFLPKIEQHYTFEPVNDRYNKDMLSLEKAMSPANNKSMWKRRSNSTFSSPSVENEKMSLLHNNTIIILELKADQSLSRMDILRDKISFLICCHRQRKARHNKSMEESTDNLLPELEVVIVLESPGGLVADYGLAARQVGRLREEVGIKVTVCVDKVAASGGYMVACMSSPGCLYAAPFAMLGSIGVISQVLNMHNALENWGVKPLIFRGGKDKAPIGIVGEITEEGIGKTQDFVDDIHLAFKRHVVSARPNMYNDIDNIATGQVWLGHDALKMGLVDRIVTSDEYIWERISEGSKVLKLILHEKQGLIWGSPIRPGFPRLIRSALTSFGGFFHEFKVMIQKVNDIFEDVPSKGMDSSEVVMRSLGIQRKYHAMKH